MVFFPPSWGILVREGQSTSSKQLADRLSTGQTRVGLGLSGHLVFGAFQLLAKSTKTFLGANNLILLLPIWGVDLLTDRLGLWLVYGEGCHRFWALGFKKNTKERHVDLASELPLQERLWKKWIWEENACSSRGGKQRAKCCFCVFFGGA